MSNITPDELLNKHIRLALGLKDHANANPTLEAHHIMTELEGIENENHHPVSKNG